MAQALDSYPEFQQGAAGYGRYFWHTFADQTDENLWVQGILPVALHQDSRYYTLGHGGIIKRGAYSFTRVLVTRTDDGNRAPNYSEIIGAGVASVDLRRILSFGVPDVDQNRPALADQCDH